MANYTYKPNEVKMFVNGTQIIAFGDNDMVKVKADTVKSGDYQSVDGPITKLIKSIPKTGKITVTLVMASPSNDFLQNLLNANTTNASVQVSTEYRTHNGLNCSIMDEPEYNYTGEINEVVWTISCSELETLPKT